MTERERRFQRARELLAEMDWLCDAQFAVGVFSAALLALVIAVLAHGWTMKGGPLLPAVACAGFFFQRRCARRYRALEAEVEQIVKELES